VTAACVFVALAPFSSSPFSPQRRFIRFDFSETKSLKSDRNCITVSPCTAATAGGNKSEEKIHIFFLHAIVVCCAGKPNIAFYWNFSLYFQHSKTFCKRETAQSQPEEADQASMRADSTNQNHVSAASNFKPSPCRQYHKLASAGSCLMVASQE